MSQRFLFVAGIGLMLCVPAIGVNHGGASLAQASQQNQPQHSSPAHVSAGHVGGSGGNVHTNTARSATKSAVSGLGKTAGTMSLHHANAVLKSTVQANTSKVQQQLAANGQLHPWHHYHHHWQWGEYGYLPSSSSNMVVGVPTGNTLTVSNSIGLAAGIGSGYGTVVVQNRAQRIASRHGLSVGGIPVVGPTMNQGFLTVRLAGVAAPTLGQPFSAQSQQHLAALAMGRHVRVFQTGVDSTGTIVGQVFLAGSGTNLNERQLRDGMAFNSVNDGFAPQLAAAEEAALMARAGLWNGNRPIAPWLMTP
jgi:endonuclease YncB( thermonuclease family)